ncbi:MAG: hypothetical protein ACYTEZ_06305 [Planctomycetota bacterium]|jgi:tetratricopeptide (TPR) repeat protein
MTGTTVSPGTARALVAVPLFLAVVCGCTTPKKRYEQASEDEAAGRWASAAAKYIDVLRRDPEFPGAREKVRATGNRALQAYLDVAGGLEGAGRHERATEEYRKVDSLVESAATVGVALETPPDYTGRRRSTFARATEALLVAADGAAAEGRWQAAVESYRRAEGRYEPSPAQRNRAREGRFQALLAGARNEMEGGRYANADVLVNEALTIHGPDARQSQPALVLRDRIRDRRFRDLLATARHKMEIRRFQEAYALLEQALAVYGPEAAASAPAHDLRAVVIEQGTVHVAALPVWRLEQIADHVPAGLLSEINDITGDEYWTKPPLFVGMIDPRAVRRELRRLDFDRRILKAPRAATLGRRLGADLVAVLFLVRCDFDGEEQPVRRPVTRRDGQPAEIELYRQRTLTVHCAYRIVDVNTGRPLDEGRVETSAGRRHPHATYAGNLRGLLLSPEEHAWFDRRRRREVDRALEHEIARTLSTGLAEAVYDTVTRHLP